MNHALIGYMGFIVAVVAVGGVGCFFLMKEQRKASGVEPLSESWDVDENGVYSRIRQDEYGHHVVGIVRAYGSRWNGYVLYVQGDTVSTLSELAYVDQWTAIALTEYIQNGCIDNP